MKDKGWTDGSVGLITISQARKNGQARTAGFRDAMKKAGITKEAGLQQMQSYTADETFKFTQDMLTANPDMRGMFIQTDQPTIGALRAIKAAHREGRCSSPPSTASRNSSICSRRARSSPPACSSPISWA